MSDNPDFLGSFLLFGGGIVLVCFLGFLSGTNTLVDLLASIFAAYILLRVTLSLSDSHSRRRR